MARATRMPKFLLPDGPSENGMDSNFKTGVRRERADVARVARPASTRSNSC